MYSVLSLNDCVSRYIFVSVYHYASLYCILYNIYDCITTYHCISVLHLVYDCITTCIYISLDRVYTVCLQQHHSAYNCITAWLHITAKCISLYHCKMYITRNNCTIINPVITSINVQITVDVLLHQQQWGLRQYMAIHNIQCIVHCTLYNVAIL